MARTIIPVDTNLRLDNAITKTVTFNGTAKDLGAGWAPDPLGVLAALIQITAIDTTSGNETYVASIEESSDNSTFTACGAQLAVSATGNVQLPFASTKRYVRVTLTLAGTTPSITYSTYVGPVL